MLNENQLKMILSENLREARLSKGWSQEQLANKTDTHKNTISCIENGTRNVSLYIALKLASVLSVSIDELVGFEGVDK